MGPVIIIIMGVSGCGKSTLGEKLAERIGAIYIEGDELHPDSNIRKMSAGIPLEDKDRWPWFDRIIAQTETEREGGKTVLVGCSALKEAYREYFNEKFPGSVKFIHLQGSFETIHNRMAARRHFMPPDLLKSQFETLEVPDYDTEKCLTLSIDEPIEDMVAKAEAWL